MVSNPAEKASEEALQQLFKSLDDSKCFILEAGAGAGKTYSLIKCLQYLIGKKANLLAKKNQQIACITYTNVAKDEIAARTDNNPIIYADTIHAFSWSLIKGFQSQMLEFIPTISDKWKTRIDEIGGINHQYVSYDLGYPSATVDEITLHHDDVIKIITYFLTKDKFRKVLISRYPIIFIDEYQDTNKELAISIENNLINNDTNVLIGFFGDHWQKIYGSTACGSLLNSLGKITLIGKNANFRSDKLIVEFLNRMRPELIQNVSDPKSLGEISVFHSNNWNGIRRDGSHWAGDLPEEDAQNYFDKIKSDLESVGWKFTPDETKVLMLTNNGLASEQGYKTLAAIFNDTDDYLKKNNNYLKYFIDTIEVVCSFYENKQYGEMFQALGTKTPRLKKHDDKKAWNEDVEKLINIRITGSVDDVLQLLKTTKRPRLSSKVEISEKRFAEFTSLAEEDVTEKEQKFYDNTLALKAVKYLEIIALSNYLDDKTPFSTKHGVKGAEFENVLVVCGRGWNHYNWNQMLEWENDGIPNNKESTFERNRNLFYVACSRPKNKLAILFTQELSNSALNTLNKWFGVQNVNPLEI